MLTIAKAAFRQGASAASVKAPAAAAAWQYRGVATRATMQAHPRNCACPTHAAPIAVAPAAASSSLAVSSSSSSSSFSLSSLLTGVRASELVEVPHLPTDAIIMPEFEERDEIECAVPKKKTSVSRQRHRRAGDRLRNRRRVYQNYRICFVCGTPVLQHHICTKCMHIPTRA